ncbi:1,3-beta-D-glucan synthase [Mortierella sp. AD011]|nr:1,3-beta-D-glucan synthase [Mortierella sp. AD010]KAF9401412.1 1,3-beta-D-glucan synthase [Mortierella sp. AD011]
MERGVILDSAPSSTSTPKLVLELEADFFVIVVSEIVFPFIMGFCVICFTFVRSFTMEESAQPGLVRVAVFAIGPMAVNAGVLLAVLGASPFLEQYMNMSCAGFGSIMAAFALAIAAISQIAFFDALWTLETWSTSHAALGINAHCLCTVQRFVFKVLIIFFLTREFKADEANRAWWTGKLA